jgi:hypothetical protein
LVIVYASGKEDEISFRGRIHDAIRKHGIIADLTSQPKPLDVLKETVQMGRRVAKNLIFRYEWRIRLSSPIDQSMLQVLRRELADLEVHDIHIENL